MTTTAPFAELLENVVDNRGKTCPTATTGTPLIATNCVKDSTLFPVFEKVRYVDSATMANWFRGHPQSGDILFVCKGSPGQTCLVPDPVNFCIAQDMVAVRADSKKVYPPYLFAALRSSGVQRQIANMHVGTMIPHFKKGDFDKLLIPLPDKTAQVAIGDLYLCLSQKIELNRRMNETLEAQARALFRDWFVDFGPVKAKMAGDTPYLAPDLWSLFPNRLDDDGVPEGWERCQVRDVLSLSYGKSLPARNRQPGSVPVYGSGGISGHHNSALIDGPTIILGRKGTVGSLFWEAAPSFPIDTVFYVVPKVSLEYCYQLLASFPLEDMNTDAAVPGLNRDNVYRLELARPSDQLLAAFDGHALALRRKLAANEFESRTLAQTRDLLLPKLMSGEIRVGDMASKELSAA